MRDILAEIEKHGPCSRYLIYLENGILYKGITFLDVLNSPNIGEADKCWFCNRVKPTTYEESLAAVRRNGYALRFIKNQTRKICLEAVERDGWALLLVKIQTPEVCLAAVRKNGIVLRYVKTQTPEICLAAVKEDWYALKFVEDRYLTEKIMSAAESGT